MEESMEEKLCEIFKKRMNINFQEHPELKDEKFFGSILHVAIREAVFCIYDIEEAFSMRIPQQAVIAGEFDSYNHVLKILKNLESEE